MPAVEEVIRRSEQGVSRPFLCRADNGETYYVKGRGSEYLTMIKEMVAGLMGTRFHRPLSGLIIITAKEHVANCQRLRNA